MPSFYPAGKIRVLLYDEARVPTRLPPGQSTSLGFHVRVASRESAQHSTAARPRRCVLVVDDEPTIRSALARYLRRRGWDADEAEDGRAALRKLGRSSPEHYQVIITDLRMPHCSGVELHDWLAQHRPDLFARLIITTGDMGSPTWSSFISRTSCPLIEKPFTLAEVALLIETVATGPQSQPSSPTTAIPMA